MYLSTVSSRLMLCDVSSWDFKKSFANYDGIIRDISWSDDGKYMLQVNPKGLIEILSPGDHDVQSLQHIPLKETWAASFHRDGHRNVAIGTRNGNVLVWDTKNKNIAKTFPTPSHQSCVNFVSYNAKNTSLAATMQNGETVIYGLVSNIPVSTVKLQCSKSISAMKFHHDSRSLLGLATDEGQLVLHDITTKKDKAFFDNAHASPVSDIGYSLINQGVVLSSGFDKIVNVYDVKIKNVVSTIRTSHTLTSISINRENQVALGTKNGLVLVYDLRDLTNPFKILKGHKDEVRKVAFQPLKKKIISADISLRENTDLNLSPQKLHSPVRSRISDTFFIGDSSPRSPTDVSKPGGDADSFLVNLSLCKPNNDDSEIESMVTLGKLNNYNDQKQLRIDTERNISKVSTPLTSKAPENFAFPSSSCGLNGIDVTPISNANMISPTNEDKENKITSDALMEVKDFLKLSLSDMSDDNKNYYLYIMMQLTKQKLFLEKQLSGMNEQINGLVQNQNALIEMNRKLLLEIEKLKFKQNPI